MKSFLSVAVTAVFLAFTGHSAIADDNSGDQMIETAHNKNGDVIPYILTISNPASPRYLVILMPGGSGHVNPERKDGKVSFRSTDNFLIRSRGLFADAETVAISTDATDDVDRILAIIDDALQRYPNMKTYIIGTSRSTNVTMKLAEILDGKVAGFIHTSSMSGIAGFDPSKLRSRNLIVHHRNDYCTVTPYSSAVYSHDRYGTDFISMEGGSSVGNICHGRAYHGYNGIEEETVDKIKAWIKRD